MGNRVMNVQAAYTYHDNVRIIASPDSLVELRKTIERAIRDGHAETSGQPIFASDGEGYSVIIDCHTDSDWGKPDCYWYQKENQHTYVGNDWDR